MKKVNIQTIFLSLAVVFLFFLVSCDPSKKYEEEESDKIQSFLSSNSTINFELKPSGLYYFETLAGTGSSPILGDSAYIKYTGSFLNGTVFDPGPAAGQLYGLIVGNSIPGFSEGLLLMKAGGKSMLLIPSALAYGATGSQYEYDQYYGYYQAIQGYTPLLFVIEMVKVVHYTGK